MLLLRSMAALAILTPCVTVSSQAAHDDWAPFASGSLVRVEAERVLYEQQGSPHYFVHLRVTALGGGPVGVDLGTPWQTIYPNQWSGSDRPTRDVVDESRAPVTRLRRAARTRLRAAFRAGTLATIPPGGSLDFYAEFNASGRADVDRQARRYVLISLAGELRVTDGSRVEQMIFDWSPDATPAADLAVPAPVVWRRIPSGARVIAR